MARVYPRLQTCLTGGRIEEFEGVRNILISLGVKDSALSVQRVMSAAFQTFIDIHDTGGKLSVKWTDGRLKG